MKVDGDPFFFKENGQLFCKVSRWRHSVIAQFMPDCESINKRVMTACGVAELEQNTQTDTAEVCIRQVSESLHAVAGCSSHMMGEPPQYSSLLLYI